MEIPIILPTFKNYTIDVKLRQFRKVNRDKPSIEFIDFDSEQGLKLFEEFSKCLDKSKPENKKLFFDVANAMFKR